MHQPIEEEDVVEEKPLSEREVLLRQKYQVLQSYRAAVRWACNVLDYKRRFEREEDFGEDGLREYIDILKEDSRRETKSIATDIKILRKQVDNIDKRLMDLSSKEKKND
jgi:hypothetical protein